jgi:hypothetical protein
MNSGRAAAKLETRGGNPLPFSRTAYIAGSLGAVEVGEHQDAEQLGAGCRAERVEALAEPALQFVGSHCREATPWNRRQHLDSRTTFLGRTAQATL